MNFISILALNPKKLFLIDALGALVSALFAALILAYLEELIGIPAAVLYCLSWIGGFYALFSTCCFLFIRQSWRFFLKITIAANTLYSCLIAILIVLYFSQLTILGLVYFTVELFVLAGLIYTECKLVQHLHAD